MSAEQERPILVFSTTWCPDCRRAKRVFEALGVRYQEFNIERDAAAAARVSRINDGMLSVPTIVFPDGTVLVEPSNAVLEAKIAASAGTRG